eukprot:CAMPEP_0178742632 /NCGR_PEP_ID=MMETSP0744-20121128/5783_1 /TAXON_ID=913974 /ORGANISM="Nitzschia punctata, Strain CCMP561" /LENGTH=200 /DNA_ID=CAMNT_0020395597 /DNA_START=25 /DNA_END=628 /DNA_ORIENTATION=-
MAQVSFVVSILSSFPLSCLSWMSPTLLKRPATVQTRRPMMSVSSSLPGVFFGPEEEFECPDEEECEIDWDKMPGYDGEDEGAASNEELLPGKSTNLYTNFVDEEDADALDDLQPKSYEHEVQNSVEKSRVLFEVNWQVDECNVDHDGAATSAQNVLEVDDAFVNFAEARGLLRLAMNLGLALSVMPTDVSNVRRAVELAV